MDGMCKTLDLFLAFAMNSLTDNFMYLAVQWYNQCAVPIKSICCGLHGVFPW